MSETKRKKEHVESELDDMSALWGRDVAVGQEEHPRAAWFRASKFAMFIHWGLYSQAANVWRGKNLHGIAEWLMFREKIQVRDYEKLAAEFNPVDFCAEDIVKLAKAAGMRYIVITAKHHEGFTLFGSEADTFNVVDATPFKRDIIKELSEACHQHKLGIGFYYSQYVDWHEENAAGNTWEFGEARNFSQYWRDKVRPQITELLSNYGPVSLIWFDTPGKLDADSSRELCDLVHSLQPECLINSRVGNGLGDYESLGDQEIPLVVPECLWETVDTHNDTWGYSIHDHHWKSSRELIGRIARVASLGGTYMLNVGPTGRGVIPEESSAILRSVGKWLGTHGGAIYDSRPSPLPAQAWGVITQKPQKLFLHVLQWPTDGKLLIPGLEIADCSASVLATGEVLKIGQENGMLTVGVPPLQPVAPITVITINYSGDLTVGAVDRILHPGIANTLEAPFCTAKHCSKGKREWMEKFGDWHHADVIEKLRDGSTISWSFNAVDDSLWNICLVYECLPGADGSELVLSLGDVRWAFPVYATGGGDTKRVRMRRETLGMISIPGPGSFTLEIAGKEVKGNDELIIQRVSVEPVA